MRPVALAIVACFIAGACAAEPLTPDGQAHAKLSDGDLLQAWSLANRACLKHTPGACDERDQIDREMPPRGFCYANNGAEGRWTRCDGKKVAAVPAPLPPHEAAPPAPPRDAAPPAPPHEAALPAFPGEAAPPPHEAAPPAPSQEAERQGPSPREAALCEAIRDAMFTSPRAAARVRALCADIAPAAQAWARTADGRLVLIVPDQRRWQRAPVEPQTWQRIYPGQQW